MTERLVIESLSIKNFRVLKDVTLTNLTPLTVLIGPNGGGKSTLLDALSFLADIFDTDLKKASKKRGRSRDLFSRGSEGPIEFEITLKNPADGHAPRIQFYLAIDGDKTNLFIRHELLQEKIENKNKIYINDDNIEEDGSIINQQLIMTKLLSLRAISKLNNLSPQPFEALSRDIDGWRFYDLNPSQMALSLDEEPSSTLAPNGANLSNVLLFLQDHHPDVLEEIFATLIRRIPRLERIYAEPLGDGRLRVMVKDVDFDLPIPAHRASDGTLDMLAYLTLLNLPNPPSLIGLEEPERHLNPDVLARFADDCCTATQRSQLFLSTHSPLLLNNFQEEDVWYLARGEDGFTQATRVADMPRIRQLNQHGGALGDLWMEGYFQQPLNAPQS